MNVSPEVLDWVRKAEADLAAAHRLAEGEPPLPDQTGFFVSSLPKSTSRRFYLPGIRYRRARTTSTCW
jgi:hypothetical protein